MRPAILVLSFALSFLCCFAQDAPVPPVKTFQPHYATVGKAQPVDTPATALQEGEVTIHQDEKITRLMDDFSRRRHTLKGYRVQLFLGDRKEAEDLRRGFLTKHPKSPAYLSYLAPNFRVRVGDLRSRLEAERLRQEIIKEYPGAYIVPDEIELPRLED
jgi:hypothetical protein